MGGYWSLGSEAPGCSGTNEFNNTAISDAYANETSGGGKGAGGYFFVGGPGIDPNYNGTDSEAYNLGVEQAHAIEAEYVSHPDIDESALPVMLDVEEDGIEGWNELNEDCSGVVAATIAPDVDRAVLNGIFQTLTGSYNYIVYAAYENWGSIFGSSSSGSIPNTAEWTAAVDKNCTNYAPLSWTQTYKTCGGTNTATFFGSQSSSSSCAVMWQWDQGDNDYDQMDTARLFACS